MMDKARFAGMGAFAVLAVLGVLFLLLSGEPDGAVDFVIETSPAPSLEPSPVPLSVEESITPEPDPVLALPSLETEELPPEEIAGPGISGIVVDTMGNPLADMYVSDGGFKRADTDESGRFQFAGLRAGAYELIPRSIHSDTQYRGRAGTLVELREGQHLQGIRLVYDRESSEMISGRVMDTSGNPIAAAKLYVEQEPDRSVAQFETGEDGYFGLEVGAGEGFIVTVRHEAYASAQRRDLIAGARNVDFVLETRGAIEGRVLDEKSGLPVTQFVLGANLTGPTGDSSYMLHKFVTTEDGTFRMEGVEPGDVLLYVFAKDYATGRVAVDGVRSDAVTRGVVVRLSRGASVDGKVVDTMGRPVAGARIRLEGQEDHWMSTPYLREHEDHDTVSDANGVFSLELLDTGYRGVTALHPDHPDTTESLRLVSGQTSRVTIVMTGRAMVEGTVRVNGKPVARQDVLVYANEDERPIAGTTDENGFYRVSNLPEGVSTVAAHITLTGYLVNKDLRVTLQSEFATTADFTFEMGDGAIRGRITRDGQPYAPDGVFVANPAGDGSWESSLSDGSVADSGNYLVSGLFPGTHRLVVALPYPINGGPSWVARDVTVRAGETVSLDIDVPGE